MATLKEINTALEENKTRIYKKDFNFFNVGFVSSLAKASIREECSCEVCRANVEKLAFLANSYPDMIARGEEGKRNFEDSIEKISNHLIKNHGYAKAGWYKALYSFVGIVAGLLVATIVVFLILADNANSKSIFLLILGIAMLAGYILGSIKDVKCEKHEKKL